MLTFEQASQYAGCRRIVRHVGTGAIIGVAIEAFVAVGRPTHLWLHGDRREYCRFSEATGKVIGMSWRADMAKDAEVAEVLNAAVAAHAKLVTSD